jgi:hypothetical protein
MVGRSPQCLIVWRAGELVVSIGAPLQHRPCNVPSPVDGVAAILG